MVLSRPARLRARSPRLRTRPARLRTRRTLRAPAVLMLLTAVSIVLSPAPAAVADQPATRAPREFVALRAIDPTILQEIRYAAPHNFTGRRVTGYLQPMCILTRTAAQALHRAQLAFLRQGYTLKVYDCYRPQRAVDDFVAWAKRPQDQRMKAEFYPRVDKSVLFQDGYIAEKSGHSRGSTMDLTLVRLPARPTPPYVPGQPLRPCYAPEGVRFPDNSLDMGTGFDCFDTLAHTLDPRIRGVQLKDRLLLKHGMEKAGFVNLPQEWWHFTFRTEPFPNTYFDFPVCRCSLVHR